MRHPGAPPSSPPAPSYDSTTVGYSPRPPGSRPARARSGDPAPAAYQPTGVSGQADGTGDRTAWHRKVGLLAPTVVHQDHQGMGEPAPTPIPVAVKPGTAWASRGIPRPHDPVVRGDDKIARAMARAVALGQLIARTGLFSPPVGRPIPDGAMLWNGNPDKPPRHRLRDETIEAAAARGFVVLCRCVHPRPMVVDGRFTYCGCGGAVHPHRRRPIPPVAADPDLAVRTRR